MNMRMYEANETLKMIGQQRITEHNSAAINDIIVGMGLPVTSDNLILAENVLQYGIIVGKRIERKKK